MMGAGVVGILLLIAFIFGAGSGYKVENWRNEAARVEAVERAQAAAAKEREFRLTVSDQFQKTLANLRITNKTIYQEVRHEVEKAVYVDPNCNLPESGVSLRNNAIDTANRAAAGGSDAAVPADTKDSSGKGGFFGRLVPSGSRSDPAVR